MKKLLSMSRSTIVAYFMLYLKIKWKTYSFLSILSINIYDAHVNENNIATFINCNQGYIGNKLAN